MVLFNREISGLCARNKAKRQRVHAVAQTGRLGAVVKEVSEMSVAKDASHFVAAHSKTQINFSSNVFFGNGRPETRPARAGVEFRLGTEERVAAANTAVKAWLV